MIGAFSEWAFDVDYLGSGVMIHSVRPSAVRIGELGTRWIAAPGLDGFNQAEIAVEMCGFGPFAGADGVAAMREIVAEYVVVNHASEREQELAVGFVADPAAALCAGFADGTAAEVDDHWRAYGEGFEDDVAECFGEE